jgi:hypothetical protein
MKFEYFSYYFPCLKVDRSKLKVSASNIQNPAIRNFSQNTERSRTKAVRVLITINAPLILKMWVIIFFADTSIARGTIEGSKKLRPLELSREMAHNLLVSRKPARGLPTLIPPPLRKLPPRISHLVDGDVRFAGAVFTRGIHSREEMGEGGVICETMPFNNESSDRLQIQHEDSQ